MGRKEHFSLFSLNIHGWNEGVGMIRTFEKVQFENVCTATDFRFEKIIIFNVQLNGSSKNDI